MKRDIQWLISLALLMLSYSCSTDPDTKPGIFKVIVAADYLQDVNTQQWIFVSDENGVSTEAYQVTNGTEITIEIPKYTPGQKFVLNLFSNYAPLGAFSDQYLTMESFAEIEPGDYHLTHPPTKGDPGPLSSHTIEISEIPFADYSFVGAYGKGVNEGESLISGTNASYTAGFKGDNADIKYYTAFDNEYRYFPVNGARPDETTVISYSEMKSFENIIQYNFDKVMKGICTVEGVNNSDYLNKTSLPRTITDLDGSQVLSYYYSDDVFDEYITTITALDAGSVKQMVSLGTSIADEYHQWSGTISKPSLLNGKLTTGLTQKASALVISSEWDLFGGEAFIYFSWFITLPGTTAYSMALPSLPKSLESAYPEWLVQGPVFNKAKAVSIGNQGAYNDIILNRFKAEAGPNISWPFIFGTYHEVLTSAQEF